MDTGPQPPKPRSEAAARKAAARATDGVWKRDEIESPCIKLCAIHPVEGICIGCHRSVAEIARWGAMTPEERREIMAGLAGRRDRLRRRRGGRAARLAE